LGELEGASGRGNDPPGSFHVVSLLANLEGGALVLVDDADRAPFPPLLADLARHAAEARDGAGRISMIVAAEEPHAVLESLGLDRAQVSIETLDPLPREDVAALIADAFAVEAAPRRAVEWAMERAGGSPGRIVGLIEELVRSGARTTDDGKLVLPRELPDTVALAGRREWGSV